jgi:transketolase
MNAPGKCDIAQLKETARKIRKTVIRMSIERGGFAGQGLALADVMAVLYRSELRLQNSPPDRLVLSVGHNAMAVYAALAEIGVYAHDELTSYNAEGSRIEQVPMEDTPGFEITNGSLGQGLAQAAGMALAHKRRSEDARIVCLSSDGEIQEGSVWESVMFAAHYRLDNLVMIVDDNDMQVDGSTSDVMCVRPILPKLAAFGWNGTVVAGDDYEGLLRAFEQSRSSAGRPFVIVLQTELCAGVRSLARFSRRHFIRAPLSTWNLALRELDGEDIREALAAEGEMPADDGLP